MKEIVLLYNIQDVERSEKIKKILEALRITVLKVEKRDYDLPILQLLAGKTVAEGEQFGGEELTDEMMVLAVKNEQLDKILKALKTEGIYLPYKAVVTGENGWWDSVKLFKELKREHEVMSRI